MRRRAGREDGSAVVELALLLPILFLVLLAAVQVGLLARDQLVLTQAARAGAREAAVSLDDATVRGTVLEAASGLDADRLEVVLSREGAQGEPVRVALVYVAPMAGPLAGWLLPASVELRASATMRQEVG